jgi:uncharacterized membrane protein YeaQ/YmgE (transglycosylase-associated protein family)
MDSTTIIGVIIQIVAGVIGGNVFAKVTTFTLGPMLNSVFGAVGGAIGSFVFQGLGLFSSGFSVGSLILLVVTGAMSGAILAVIASLFWHPIEY